MTCFKVRTSKQIRPLKIQKAFPPGHKVGGLTVVKLIGATECKWGDRSFFAGVYLTECDCGNFQEVIGYRLKRVKYAMCKKCKALIGEKVTKVTKNQL